MAFNITDFSNKWANFKEDLKGYFNNRVVDKNGDTMTGSLILSKNPEASMEAVTKEYVDAFWEFTPGDNLLKKIDNSDLKSLITYHTDDENIIFRKAELLWGGRPYGYIVGHTVEKHIPININPLSDGFLKFKLGNYCIFGYYFQGWMNYEDMDNFIENSLDAIYDVKIIYQTDTMEDVVLYEKQNISCSERGTWIPAYVEGVVPIKKHQQGMIVVQYTFASMTDNLANHSGTEVYPARFIVDEVYSGFYFTQYSHGNTTLVL